MDNIDKRPRPKGYLQSADRILLVMKLLRDSGPLTVSEIARSTGLPLGTVHRVLSMLVYRDFAVQDHDRSYSAGPALAAPLPRNEQLARIQQVSVPYLELLAQSLGETFNLMVRTGTAVRVLASVEGASWPRVGSRQNAVLPAMSTAGGRALLAALPDEWIRRLFTSPAAVDAGTSLAAPQYRELILELQRVRQDGYSMIDEQTETGVAALGFALPPGAEAGPATLRAALSMAVPSARSPRLGDTAIHGRIKRALLGIAAELDRLPAAG
ncbi:MAG: IclR family transcriptional regulator [Citricoccus sp.]